MKKYLKKYLSLICVTISVLTMSIVYAAFSSTLTIESGEAVVRADADIRVTDVSYSNYSGTTSLHYNPKYSVNTVSMFTTIGSANSQAKYTVSITNNTSNLYKISSVKIVSKSSTTATVSYYDTSLHTVTTSGYSMNAIVPVNSTQNYQFRIADTKAEDVDVVIQFTFEIYYPKCKAATILHSYTSGSSSSSSSSGGSSTTSYYGTIPTSTLTPGAAFDCDINSDKVYDSTTERFYYLGNSDIDPGTAALLYYTNYSSSKAYHSSNNYSGPVSAVTGLPTISDWGAAVHLTVNSRQIKNQSGGTTITIPASSTSVSYPITHSGSRLVVTLSCNASYLLVNGSTTCYLKARTNATSTPYGRLNSITASYPLSATGSGTTSNFTYGTNWSQTGSLPTFTLTYGATSTSTSDITLASFTLNASSSPGTIKVAYPMTGSGLTINYALCTTTACSAYYSNVSSATATISDAFSLSIPVYSSTQSLPVFSYDGYAAKLPTYQQIVDACGSGTPTNSGYLNNCPYVMEGLSSSTGQNYWLETPYNPTSSSNTNRAYNVLGATQTINTSSVTSSYGVRPLIEVYKTDIFVP